MISFKNKKFLVFDLDGTIVDLAVDWKKLKKELSQRYSRLYGENCDFHSISGCLDYVVEKKDKEELNNFFNLIESHETKNLDENIQINETVFFIKNLELFNVNEDVKLSVLSLNTRKTITESLKLINILDKFDFIVGREDVRKWKPNPEGLLKVQEHYGCKKEEMIYFGDMKKDLQAGQDAGIETHLIDELIELVNQKRQDK
ncbi:MAG: HAD family hydrolase [Promethearchaeota archaeon]|nr:MAG: HAD family hydrolase [Candidatus Lokiarchaeota archaeon]